MTKSRRARPFREIGVEHILGLCGSRRLVIIAPHPDDETLGCGGLIARAVRRSVSIAVIALTDGDASHPSSRRWPPAALGRLRASEMRRSLARLGARGVAIRRLGWRDGGVETDGDVSTLRSQLVAIRAGVILVTSAADHHLDHRAAARLAKAAARDLRLPVIQYAVWSRIDTTQHRPDRHQGAKRWAMTAHRSQITDYIIDDPAGFRLHPATLSGLTRRAERFAVCGREH